MKGEFYIEFDKGGKPGRLIPHDDKYLVPSDMQACLSTEPPAWAIWALNGYKVLQQEVHAVGVKEDEADKYAKQLRGMIEKAGPVLTPVQATEVDRIKNALSNQLTAAQIDARTRGGDISR